MNNQGRSIIGRRGILLSLAAVGVAAGLLWFSMIGGVGATSADGGGPNSGSQVGQATQQYGDQPPDQHLPAAHMDPLPRSPRVDRW